MIKKITLRVDEYSVKTGEEAPKFNVFRAFGNFIKNRAAVGATIAAMGMFLGMQSAATATAIMFATYFKQAQLSGLVQLVGFLPMFLFMPFVKKLVNKFGKKEAATAGTVVSLIGGLILLVFPLVPMSLALPVYMVGLVLFGLGMGFYTCVSWAMMSDAIDYNEWKFGTREEGTVYSLHSFFRKLAQGVGPSVVIALLGVLGYVESAGTTGQTPEMAYKACWLVAGLYLFSAVCQFVGIGLIYNLDKKTLATMTEELNARRAAAPAATTTAEGAVAPEVANITID
jgi:GPH family glycoside/pentoside/hexuronide:cation symporter